MEANDWVIRVLERAHSCGIMEENDWIIHVLQRAHACGIEVDSDTLFNRPNEYCANASTYVTHFSSQTVDEVARVMERKFEVEKRNAPEQDRIVLVHFCTLLLSDGDCGILFRLEGRT